MTELVKEENLKKEIEENFKEYLTELSIQRKNRIWLTINKEQALNLMLFLKNKGYFHLSTITGFDEGEKLGAIYHITDYYTIINIRVRTEKENPILKTVKDIYPVCDSYERELVDLFGIKIEGLPEGRNYPLPENFPKNICPLKKSVKLKELLENLNKSNNGD